MFSSSMLSCASNQYNNDFFFGGDVNVGNGDSEQGVMTGVHMVVCERCETILLKN